jgi:hypothetical protein
MSAENMDTGFIICNLLTTVSVVLHTVKLTKLVVTNVRSRLNKPGSCASSRPIAKGATKNISQGVRKPSSRLSKKKGKKNN